VAAELERVGRDASTAIPSLRLDTVADASDLVRANTALIAIRVAIAAVTNDSDQRFAIPSIP
jgi:hypothetical protein